MGSEETPSPPAQEAEPIELWGQEGGGGHIVGGGEDGGDPKKGDPDMAPVGPVEVREEEDAAPQKGQQSGGPVELVEGRVLQAVLQWGAQKGGVRGGVWKSEAKRS